MVVIILSLNMILLLDISELTLVLQLHVEFVTLDQVAIFVRASAIFLLGLLLCCGLLLLGRAKFEVLCA